MIRITAAGDPSTNCAKALTFGTQCGPCAWRDTRPVTSGGDESRILRGQIAPTDVWQ